MPRVSRFGFTAVSATVIALVACEPLPPVGSLRVTVVQGDPIQPVANTSVQVAGLPFAASTAADGIATLAGIPPGEYTVSAKVTGYPRCPATVLVTAAMETAVTLNVSACGDRLVTNSAEFTALLDIRSGSGSGTCLNDLLLDGVDHQAAVQPAALSSSGGGASCHAAGWVFASEHAPYHGNDPTVFPWTDANGDEVMLALPASRLRVPLTVWIADKDLDAGNVATELTGKDLPESNEWLRTSRSGLRLTRDEATDDLPEVIDVGSLIDPDTGLPPYPAIGNGCAHAMSIVANKVAYRRGHLNVYVVGAIDGDGIPAGRHCGEQGAPNVVFVDGHSILETPFRHLLLLHELAHALGVSRPDNGHADLTEGLRRTNIMWSYIGTNTGDPVLDHMSVGQLARMHVSEDSWLNVPSDENGKTVRTRQPLLSFALTTSCGCPAAEATDDCPALQTDIVRTDVANPPPTTPQACRVSVDQACVSVAPNGTATFTAHGWANAGTTMGVGSASVASLDPAVAQVVKQGEGPGRVTALVTGGASPGATTILVSLGGNLTPVAVNVGAPCT